MPLRRLNNEEVGRLADGLLECRYLLALAHRQAVVRCVEGASSIPESSVPRDHVLNILHRCALDEYGLEDLLNQLARQPDVEPFCAQLERVCPRPVGWESLNELKRQLPAAVATTFTDDQLAAIYRQVSGDHVDLPEAPPDGNLLFRYLDDLANRRQAWVVAFLERAVPNLQEPVRQSVLSWIANLTAQRDVLAAPAHLELNAEPSRNELAYLLVVVTPTHGKHRYVVTGTLKRREYACLDVPCPADVGPTDLPDIINAYRSAALRSLAPRPSTDLAIELFLPNELLDCDADRWLTRMGANVTRPIGTHHPFVVRSQTRLYDPEFLNFAVGTWIAKWTNVPDTVARLPDARVCAITSVSQLTTLYDRLVKDAVVLMAVTGLGPSAGAADTRALNELIDSGVPIAIWPRSNSTEPEQAEADVGTLVCGSRFKAMPMALRDNRRDANATTVVARCIWNDLVLLWDDPCRIPPGTPAAEYMTEDPAHGDS
jgi:hypothetical protein